MTDEERREHDRINKLTAVRLKAQLAEFVAKKKKERLVQYEAQAKAGHSQATKEHFSESRLHPTRLRSDGSSLGRRGGD